LWIFEQVDDIQRSNWVLDKLTLQKYKLTVST
jgi:hypothetical protein